MKDFKNSAAGIVLASGMLMAGCGGGGGGDGLTPTAPAPAPVAAEKPAEPAKPLQFAADRTELNFINVNGALPMNDVVTLNLSGGSGSGDLYAFIEADANLNDGTYYVDMVSDTAMKVTIAPQAQPEARSVDGNLLLKICAEDPCQKTVWSQNFPYRYRNYTIKATEVRQRIIGTVDNIRVGEPIEPRAMASDLRVTASADEGAAWLDAKIDSNGNLALNIDSAGMRLGTYSGEVRIGTANEASGTLRIPVSVTIDVGFTLPASTEVVLDAASPPLITGKIAMDFNGASSLVWTAVSDKPWLILRQSSGTGSADVGYTIDTAQLAGLANTESETASVTFAAPGVFSRTYQIAVRKNLPRTASPAPYPLNAGQTAGARFKFGR